MPYPWELLDNRLVTNFCRNIAKEGFPLSSSQFFVSAIILKGIMIIALHEIEAVCQIQSYTNPMVSNQITHPSLPHVLSSK